MIEENPDIEVSFDLENTINHLLKMSFKERLDCLARISDEELLKINDEAVGSDDKSTRNLFEDVKSEIYARWVAEKEDVAIKEEKERNLLRKMLWVYQKGIMFGIHDCSKNTSLISIQEHVNSKAEEFLKLVGEQNT